MRKVHSRYILGLIVPLLLFCRIDPAEKSIIPEMSIGKTGYVPLFDIVKITGAGHTYNPIARRGKLFVKEHQAVYLEECSAMIIDGYLYRAPGPVTRKNDEIYIPSSHFRELVRAFYPSKILEKAEGGFLITDRASGETSKTPAPTPSYGKKGTATAPPVAAEKIGFIILDPGHGGKDPGAVGGGKTYEKTITLAVAKQVAAHIKAKHPSIKIYLTRTNDTFLELSTRTSFANRKLTSETGGLFVSIHVNASIIPKMTGIETYFLSQNPTNEDARTTAALENNVVILEKKGSQKSYDDIEQIEALMLTTQIQKESSDLADNIQNSLIRSIKESPSRGVKTADFYVLRGALMPAALVEIGYITNSREMSRLVQKEYQGRISKSISDGITVFLTNYNKQR